MKEYTLDELQREDGQDGNKSLVATDGKVWNVTDSKVWPGGKHFNTHQAGRDLTTALLAAPHGADVLDRFEQVGTLGTDRKKKPKYHEFPEPSPLVKKILDQHPHPISAHFPIGLGITASLFAVMSLFFEVAGLSEAAFFNLIVAALSAPASIGAGILSWHYNYGGTWTAIFRTKSVLSLLLLSILGAAIALKIVLLKTAGPNPALNWIYIGLVALVAPIVAAIGRLGGKVTFPG